MQAGPSRKKERQARPARKTKRRENNQKLETTIVRLLGRRQTSLGRSFLFDETRREEG
jgi:hypothetical protein